MVFVVFVFVVVVLCFLGGFGSENVLGLVRKPETHNLFYT